MAWLEARQIGNACLAPVSLSVVALLGPSGAGKTTLVKILAGLLPYRGEVWLDGQCLDACPPHRRSMGYLSQELHLFPHLTVRQNLRLALMFGRRQWPDRDAVDQALQLAQISHRADRRPAQLSGGEKQRAALARALVARPQVLLLDEPFCRLDQATRETVWLAFQQMLQQQQTTLLLVTHDPQEALLLTDRQLFLDQGKLIAWEKDHVCSE